MIKRLITSLALFLGITFSQNLDSLGKLDNISKEESLSVEQVIGDHWPGMSDTVKMIQYSDSTLDPRTNLNIFIRIGRKKNAPSYLKFYNYMNVGNVRKTIEIKNNYPRLSSIDDISVFDGDTSEVIKKDGVIIDTVNWIKYHSIIKELFMYNVYASNAFYSKFPSKDVKTSTSNYRKQIKDRVKVLRLIKPQIK